MIKRTRNTPYRIIYHRVPNGTGFLWFVDGYFFKTLKGAKEAMNDPSNLFRLFPDIRGTVKHPRNIDRTVWFPISLKDGTWYQRSFNNA